MAGIDVRIGANTDGLDAALRRSQSQIRQLTGELKRSTIAAAKYGAAATAAGVAVGAALVKQSLKAVDALAKTSDKLGIAVADLQALRHAADLTGVGTNQLEMGLQRMTRRVAEASKGMGEAQDAIKQLGLDAQDLARLSPDEQFRRITAAMEGVSSQGEKIRLAFKLFDSEGVNLVNTMALGADGLADVRRELDDLGVALTRVDAAQIEAANDSFTRIGLAVDGISNQMAVQLAPVIEAVALSFLGAAKESGGMASVAAKATNAIIDGAAFAVNAVEGIRRTFELAGKSAAVFALGVKEAALRAASAIINGPIEAVNLLIEQFNRLPGIDIEPLGISNLGQGIRDELALTSAAIRFAQEDMQATLLEPLPGMSFERMVEETRENAAKAAEEIAAAKDLIAGRGNGEDDEEEKVPLGYSDTTVAVENDRLMQMVEANKRGKQAIADLDAAYNAQREADVKKGWDNVISLTNSRSRKLFEIGKVAAIADATINAYKGAAKTLGEYPQPLAGILAAAHLAAGLAQVQNIKAQSFNGGGGGGTGVNTGATGNAAPAQQQTPQQNQIVSINLEGEIFGRDQVRGLIGQINDALDDGYTLRV